MKLQRSAYDVMRDHAFKDSDLLGIGYVIVFLFVVVVLSSTDDYGEVFGHCSTNGQNKIQPAITSATDQHAAISIQRLGGDEFALNDTVLKKSDLDKRDEKAAKKGVTSRERTNGTNDSIEAEISVVPAADSESEVIGNAPSDESDKARYDH